MWFAVWIAVWVALWIAMWFVVSLFVTVAAGLESVGLTVVAIKTACGDHVHQFWGTIRIYF